MSQTEVLSRYTLGMSFPRRAVDKPFCQSTDQTMLTALRSDRIKIGTCQLCSTAHMCLCMQTIFSLWIPQQVCGLYFPQMTSLSLSIFFSFAHTILALSIMSHLFFSYVTILPSLIHATFSCSFLCLFTIIFCCFYLLHFVMLLSFFIQPFSVSFFCTFSLSISFSFFPSFVRSKK